MIPARLHLECIAMVLQPQEKPKPWTKSEQSSRPRAVGTSMPALMGFGEGLRGRGHVRMISFA